MTFAALAAACLASIALRCVLDLYTTLTDPPPIWGDEQ